MNCPVGSALEVASAAAGPPRSKRPSPLGCCSNGNRTLAQLSAREFPPRADEHAHGYTLLVDYGQAGTFSVQVLQIAASGASLVITVDNSTTNRVNWPAPGVDLSTNYVLTVNVSPGPHTIRLTNPGQDWVTLGNIALNPYTSILGAYQVGNSNFSCALALASHQYLQLHGHRSSSLLAFPWLDSNQELTTVPGGIRSLGTLLPTSRSMCRAQTR